MQFLKKLFLVQILFTVFLLAGCTTDPVEPETQNYTVTFDANGGEIKTTTQTVQAGKTVLLLSAETLGLSREGYAFIGWALSADAKTYEYGDGVPIALTQNTTFYAIWMADDEIYTITFDAGGGEIQTTSQSVTKGESLTILSAETLGLSRRGYFFKGWTIDASASTAAYEDGAAFTPSQNITLYAVWEKGLDIPAGLTLSELSSSNKVTLTWTDTSDATYYWVYYSTTNNPQNATVATRSATSGTTGYEIKLSQTGDYYFWVRGAKSSSSYASESSLSEFSDVVVYTGFDSGLTAPTGVTAKASSTKNKVTVTWTGTGAAEYWIYYNTTNDTSTAKCYTHYGYSGYSVSLSESGTYYFWVKSADGYYSTDNASDFSEVAVYEFTYTELTAPTEVAVKASSTKNKVTVTWTGTGAEDYWIYYNTTNDTSTAKCYTRYGYSGYSISLSESGTYYFWVKAADGYYSTDKSSDFSEVASYEFTYTELSAPTGVAVKASSTKNKVTVTWTGTGAEAYWIYYNTTNDTSTAKCYTRYGYSGYSITLSESGTYYFWVKAADGSSTSSKSSDFSEVATYEFTYVE